MPQSPFDRAILGGLVALIAASAANAQSFNIDLSATGTVTPSPPPASTYGAAAAQPGVWNNITDGSANNVPLVNLAGAPTSVTFSLDGGFAGAFPGGPNSNWEATPANSNSEFLLDDGWDPIGFDGNIFISNLAPGTYNIYTYGVAPDSLTDLTRVSVVGAVQGPQTAGGALPNPFLDTYVLGLTHTLHTITLAAPGTVNVFIDDPIGNGEAQTVNGLQIQLVPTPGALAMLGLSGLVGSGGRRRRR